MTLLEKIVLLSKVPLFAELRTDELQRVAEISGLEGHPADSRLFREGDPGDCLYIVVEGVVEIFPGDDRSAGIATLGEHDFLGELSLFEADTRTASAACRTDARFLVIDREDMEELLQRYPAIAQGFIRTLIRRMRENLGASDPS